MLRTILLAFASVVLFACSSGSSSGRSNNGPPGPEKPEPEPGTSFILGGAVSGLTGQLILSNGLDNNFAVINRDGLFAFPSQIPSGELYNVRVESRPSDQICEVINSRNFLVRDTDNIRVYCARAVERPVVFNRPVNLNLNKLVLSSNHQRLGSNTSPALQESGNSLLVFDNSYVSLSVLPSNASEPEPILLAHVHDMREYMAASEAERRPIVLNRDSTIKALLLLEPTIATAVMERARLARADMKDLVEDLLTALATTPEYQNLSDKIHSLIGAQKTLWNHGGELNEPLYALVQRAAEVLLETQAQVSFSQESVPGSGVEITTRQEASGDLWLEVRNYASRTVTVQLPKFAAIYLPKTADDNATPGSGTVTSLRITGGIAAQESLQVNFTGPGALGTVTDSRKPAFIQALIRSGTEQHFFPSVNLMLGLLDPLHFDLSECLETEYDLSVSALQNLVSDVAAPGQYSVAYNKVFDGMRGRFIGSGSDQKLMQEMFACEKFGVGSYIETQDKLNLAKNQVRDMLRVARTAYNPVANPLELFADPGMTLFTASIAATAVDSTWIFSNKLQLQVVAAPTNAAPDQSIRFQASCMDPSSNNALVACDIGWEFGDGFIKLPQNFAAGLSEEAYAYTNEGNYLVRVTAKRPEGVQVSQSLNIVVQATKPRILVKKSDGTPLNPDTGILDFGLVTLGSHTILDFTVTNDGTAPLIVDNIVSSDAVFSATPTAFTLAAKESRLVQLRFTPAAAQKYSGRIDIINNGADPERQIFQLALTGEGFLQGSPANGGWSLVQNGVTSNFVVQRAKVDLVQDGKWVIRIFGSATGEFPQILLNVSDYQPGVNRIYTLDDTASEGCKGSFILNAPENTYCTATHAAVSQPLTGSVQVTHMANNQKTIQYQFDAALNAITCGNIDTAQCPKVRVEGTASFSAPF